MPEPEEPGPAPPPVPSPLAAIDARVTGLEQAVNRSSTAVQAGLDREAEDRSWIARAILWVFVISVAIVLLILWTDGFETKEWNQVALQAADLIKTSVLPVVTLVLGFYFGSRAGKG